MKIAAIFVLLAVMLVAVCASPFRERPWPGTNPGNTGFPNFPGQGPFNPTIPPWHRHRRSPGVDVVVDQPIDGRPGSASVDMNHELYSGDHGRVSVYGGGNVQDGGSPRGQAGVRAEFHWGDGGGSSMSDAARMAEIDRIRKEMKID